MKSLFFFLASVVFMPSISAQKQTKLIVGQSAPDFTAIDSHNDTIRLSDLKGKKVYLTLYRNVGCAVCNLRFHEIEMLKDTFASANIVVIAVYESSLSKLQEYTDGEQFNTKLIANPDFSIFNSYGAEISGLKAIKSLFHGVFSKGKKGSKLFKKTIKQDGNKNRIGAEFIIDENGKILLSHYHRYIGDHLPTEVLIKALIN